MDSWPWGGPDLSAGSIEVKAEPDGVVLHMQGEIDALAMDRWRNSTHDEAPKVIAVDVGAMTYIDSTGLAFLVQWAKDCALEDRPALIRGATARFDQTLELIGLSSMFVREG
ncbi:STAS domain-containing protein [Geodermatophilus sp. URMC 64]